MEELKKAVEAKRKKYEAQGFADKDFQKTIDGAVVKMWLPDSVFEQQKMILMATNALSSDLSDVDEASSSKQRYANEVAKYTQINRESLDIQKSGLANCEAYCMIYWTELLAPLSVWAESKARKMLTS